MSERAVTRARQILAQGDFGMPVNVEAVARHLGLSIRLQDLEDNVSGVLVVKDSMAIIAVNGNHHPHRQRFTMAHEIGHYLLHCNTARVFIDAAPVFFRDERSPTGIEPQEIEANAFAAELLMPESVLRQVIGRQPIDVFDDAAVRGLASHFGVSAQAVTIRLTKLDLITV